MKPVPSPAFTRRVIGRAIEVHRHLGAGLAEIFYEDCLCEELTEAEFAFERQKRLPSMHYANSPKHRLAHTRRVAPGPRAGEARPVGQV